MTVDECETDKLSDGLFFQCELKADLNGFIRLDKQIHVENRLYRRIKRQINSDNVCLQNHFLSRSRHDLSSQMICLSSVSKWSLFIELTDVMICGCKGIAKG